MPKCFTLSAPPGDDAKTFDSIHYLLQSAEIDVEQQSPHPDHPGHLVYCDHEKDWDWVCYQILQAHGKHVRTLVIWMGNTMLSTKKIWELFDAGANEIVQWHWNEHAATQLTSRLKRWLHIDQHFEKLIVQEKLVGNSGIWRAALRNLIETSVYSQAPVLILGESGTGKEMAARLIHQFDIRPYKQDLTLLDCSSIVPELSGSEFFGHEKGAFTNAINARDGAFATANKGTLFLDEIGELPVHLQAELLRATQEGTYKRVGSNQWQRTEFRLVSATNRDLNALVAEQKFRQDLYYRISTWVCQLPPLRERVDDIPCLVHAFLKQLIPDEKKRPVVDPLVMSYLCLRSYPGNVRELRQVVTRLVNRYVGVGTITLGDVPECDRLKMCGRQELLSNPDFAQFIRMAIQNGQGLKSIVKDIAFIAKEMAIEEARGNLQSASELLQVSDRTLQMHFADRGREI